jgi:RHS repeat-associated protein
MINTRLLIALFLLAASSMQAQIIGGRENGQSAPKEVAPATLNKGAFTNDVNLFNGTLNTSYSLGSVSTPSGLNYELNLNYSSTSSQGDNITIASGIPYGEGWNLSIPTITIEAESYYKYSEAQLSSINSDPDDDNDDYDYAAFNSAEAEAEGGLYWLSPKISIPGVISERFIYKFSKGDNAIFVPASFTEYVEARFNGQVWTVITGDGTQYLFNDIHGNPRNASNQRVLGDNTITSGEHYEQYPDPSILKNVIIPKFEVLSWYCSTISNPEHPAGQKIIFDYDRYGEFNYYKEFLQEGVFEALYAEGILSSTAYCIPGLGSGYLSQPLPKLLMYKDILLKSVSATSWSSFIESIDLTYKTAYPTSGVGSNILYPGRDGVSRLDSLYNYKTVYSIGLSDGSDALEMEMNSTGTGDFDDWYRYNHARSDNSYTNSNNPPYSTSFSATNPYVFSIGGYDCFDRHQFALNPVNLDFSHGFLESPRLDDITKFIPGDTYEIRTFLHSSTSNKFCNFDINIVTGSSEGEDADTYPVSGCSDCPRALSTAKIVRSKSENVFSTFNQALKWNLAGTRNSQITSNFFTMPCIPSEFDGFNIQIGPANSDHKFDLDYSDFTTTFAGIYNNTTAHPDPIFDANEAYFNFLYPFTGGANYNNASALLEPCDKVPNNFGIGLSWQMMDKFYDELAGGTSNFTARQKFWWNEDLTSPTVFTWDNIPTATGDDVELRAIALIRYSKNPYMLAEVNHYRVYGEIDGITNPGYKLVSKLKLSYEATTDNIKNNKIYASGQTAGNNGIRTFFLLASIQQIPVDPSNPGTTVSYTASDVPTTRFSYTKYDNDYATWEIVPPNVYFSPALSKVIALTRIVDQLGSVTEYEYHPVSTDPSPLAEETLSHYITSRPYVNFFTGTPSTPPENKKPKPFSTQIYLAVKTKKVYSETDLEDPLMIKRWDYEYAQPVQGKSSPGASLSFGNHFRNAGYIDLFGFETTVVTEPLVETGVQRAITNYYHHSDEEDGKLFGKLYKIENIDELSRTIKKTEITYDVKLAYKNASYVDDADLSYMTRSVGDDDYMTLFYSDINEAGGPQITWTADQPIKMMEGSAAFSDFTSLYMNSYFIAKVSEKVTEYNSYPVLSVYSVANSTMTRGQITSLREPISMNTCSRPKYAMNEISSLTEYKYWDAGYDGVTECEGYRILLGPDRFLPANTSTTLRYEPSWQLYSKKTSSPQLPNTYSKEEYFYYYDLLNFYHPYGINNYAPLPGFGAYNNAFFHNLREIAYEKRGTVKTVANDPSSSSEYYWYSTEWNQVEAETEAVVVSIEAEDVECPTFEEEGDPNDPPDVNAPVTCVYVRHYVGQAPPPGYVLRFYNSMPYFCPGIGPASGAAGRASNIDVISPDPNDPPPGLANVGGWVNGKLAFSRLNRQVDTKLVNPEYVEASEESGDGNYYNILRFSYEYSSETGYDMYEVEFPFDTLKTYEVLERNHFGQVSLERDAKGLMTRYGYELAHNIWHVDDDGDWCNNYSSRWYERIGVPTSITIGETLVSEPTRVIEFTYYPNHSINTVTDPNDMEMEYTYDVYGRLKEKYRNSQLLNKNAYHQFGNTATNETLDFNERTEQNYIETYVLNENGSNVAVHSRAYQDPLGRVHSTLSQISPDASISALGDNMVHSGTVIYDNWGRSIKSYKPFLYTATAATFDIRNSNLSGPYSASVYEMNQDDRILRSSPTGENINTGHATDISYRFIKGNTMVTELNLSTAERALIVPSPAGVYVYRKTITTDEDGRQTISYENAKGQKVATKQYITATSAAVTLFVYDDNGNISMVINPQKQEANYDYNLLGWMYRKETVDGGVSKYMFNKSGQVVLEQDANAAAGTDNSAVPYLRLYKYNEMGELTEQSRVELATAPLTVYTNDNTVHSPLEYASYTTGTSNVRTMDFSDASTCDFSYNEILDPTGERTNPYGNLDLVAAVKEKEWKYNSPALAASYPSSSIGTYLGSNAPAKVNGRLSYSTAYDAAGNPVDHCIYSYNTEGQPAYEIHKFTKGATTISSLITYPSYNLRGSLKQQKVDIGLNGSYEKDYELGYDDWNRLESVTVDGNLLATYDYDDALGLLQEKKYYTTGSSCNVESDETEYTYDVRNRLTAITSELFSENLYYDSNLPSTGTIVYNVDATTNYNGNINAIKSQYLLSGVSNYGTIGNSMDGATYYGYTYDRMNRLTNADASVMNVLTSPVSTNPALRYGDETFTYDKAGNILSLERGQYYLPGTLSPANEITSWLYNYTSGTNRLTDLNVSNSDYTYDNCGNLRTDERKNITAATYGRGNLPSALTVNSKSLAYLYDQDDSRIYKENTTDNIKEFYLQDLSGKTLGIYDLNATTWTWYVHGKDRIAKFGSSTEFFESDHLGNTRVTYTSSVNCSTSAVSYTVVNAEDYYAYGKILRSYEGSGSEKFRFNGKERDVETQNDYFESRFYDSDIAKFLSTDPHAESYANWSPYCFTFGSPTNFNDPTGMDPSDFLDKEGKKISHVEDGSNAVYQLTGTNQTNESFQFKEFQQQGANGKNEISIEGAVTGAQDYVTNNYTKCNQSVNFVGRTFESANKAAGNTVDNIGIVNGNSLARGITADLSAKVTAETSVATAQESAKKGNLVVGANGGHVVTMTTKTFDVTRYNGAGGVIEQKQIAGGKTTNVNGSVRPTNIGPEKSNSFQNPVYSGMTWYSLTGKKK